MALAVRKTMGEVNGSPLHTQQRYLLVRWAPSLAGLQRQLLVSTNASEAKILNCIQPLRLHKAPGIGGLSSVSS